jgi:mono/diheme cytochrome c family protein
MTVMGLPISFCGRHLAFAALVVGVQYGLTAPHAIAADKLEYNRDVRPILAENCFACHGPDSASRKAALRLDQRDAAIKAEVLVPGKAEESEIVRRIFSQNPKQIMPPVSSHKTLTAAQKTILKQWIAAGAEYQLHWSYLKPVRPELPTVRDSKWARNPVDLFLLAKLEAARLKPAPEADRRTLARRLSLDLTGLPPDPKDVDVFVNDPAPDAYERYVDSLLASPHWGEHRARYWLDVARYADTHGLHFDNYREMWAYRDWVIEAFNKNLHFDQFTIEQLAGDLLPNPTLDQLIASGFNRCNVTTNEGGTIAEENLVFYTRDRTETVAQIWLGLTANCAVCHDHKFDALSMRDFYSLSAFFNNSTQGPLDGNVSNTPPIVFVPRRADRARWEQLTGELAALKEKLAQRKKSAMPEFDIWVASAKRDTFEKLIPASSLLMRAGLNEGSGKTTAVQIGDETRAVELADGFEWTAGHVSDKAFGIRPGKAIELAEVGDFEKDQPFAVAAWIKPGKRGITGAIASRMDNGSAFRGWDLWLENDRVGTHIINRWPDDALKVTARMAMQPNQWYHVLVCYDGSGKAAGVTIYINGVAQTTDVFTDKLQNTIRTKVPFKVGQRNTSERVQNVALQDLRVYGHVIGGTDAGLLARGTRAAWLLAKEPGKRTAQEKNELMDAWLLAFDTDFRDLSSQQAGLQQLEAGIRGRGAVTHVMLERKEPPEAYILFRGDYDKRRDKVKAATPTVLPPMAADLPGNRLGFAKWLVDPEHPLTARVTVNRLWQELFGTGLVRTAGDFGVSGELPSHPELLDWLAVEFRESGWDVKRFFKMLVTSAAYRQSAALGKESLQRDPQNLLLSRGPRFRMDAEMLRDYALTASGLLVQELGGPSLKPYQPEGVWEAVGMIGSDTRVYQRDKGEKLYRRSLYTFWKRGAPPASMEILNAPSREFCTVRRERTNTPLQALVTLNDPQFVEAARTLAQLAIQQGGETLEARANFMALRLLARPLRPEEMGVLRGVVSDLLAHYQANPADARKLIDVGESRPAATIDAPVLAAWTMAANQLMNLDEVLTK